MTCLKTLFQFATVASILCGYQAQRSGNRPTRTIYIGAVEVDWDYAPNGNQLGPGAEEYLDLYLTKSSDPLKLGQVYKKAVLREYTDDSFSIQKPREAWLGILGPVLRGEVGDILNIVFYNKASHPISIHPHGVRYEKIHEGALYDDNTTDAQKMDDHVQPGEKHVYRWLMNDHDAPTERDPDCLTWMYHSHRSGETELHAGLLGPLLVCKPGTLRNAKIDKRIVLVFMNFDESKSIYIDENIDIQAPNLSHEEKEKIKQDAEFRASNLMHTINGYAFGNLEGLELCVGDKVSWHLVGMGDVVDVHTASFEGHVMQWNGHTTDDVNLFAAKFATAYMVARRPGTWPVRCEVGSHGHSGMEAFFHVRQCGRQKKQSDNRLNGKMREIFIAVEEVEWNYAPSGINFLSGRNLTEDKDSSQFFERNPHKIGGVYRKAKYVEYTDESFAVRKISGSEDMHLALLGPTIRAEVGDVIKLTLRNNARWPYSIDSHGAYYIQTGPVQTNQTQTVYWSVLDQYGPTELDPDCLPWRYNSEVDFRRDAYDGLNGIFMVCRPGSLTNDGKQKKVDREFSLLFSAVDENVSHYLDDNVLNYTTDPYGVDFYDREFTVANRRYSINGRMYGNLEGLVMCKGDKISWNILGVGRSIDLHTAYFHGNNFEHNGINRDTITVVPSIIYSVNMVAENEGDWVVECRTNSHLTGGMRALYRVEDCSNRRPKRQYFENEIPSRSEVQYFDKASGNTVGINKGTLREYFLAVVEEEWEYAPLDRHLVHGGSLLDTEESRTFVERGDQRIGSRYIKALYREYTDATFTKKKQRTSKEDHLGVMGPYIKAEVFDTVKVTFRNMASRPYSLHPHGITNLKNKERKSFTSDEQAVLPGDTYVYEWLVPESAGPPSKGFNCTPYAYYSAVDPVKDTNAGLIGPLIICKKGILTERGARRDVQHEFAVLYTIFDENESWYIGQNVQRFCRNPNSVDLKDASFRRSNRMHAVNGRIYGTLEGLVARNGTKSAWYLLGMGSEDDLHTAHFHGQTFLTRSDGAFRRGDVVDLFPGFFDTVEMTNDNPGTWILHCHVDDHMSYGMAALFTVTGR